MLSFRRICVETTEGDTVIYHELRRGCPPKSYIPAGDLNGCYWLGAFRRQGSRATPALMLRYIETMLPLAFVFSGGAPIATQVDRGHALALRRVCRRLGYRWQPIAGTLAGGEPISDYNELTGGSDDEQVILLRAVG